MKIDELPRVKITQFFFNLFTMQVCAVDDASDQEILDVCNRENETGIAAGWSLVIREPDGSLGQEPNKAPVRCSAHDGRTHFLVIC